MTRGSPPYLEIEAGSTEEVIRVAGLLSCTDADLTGENIGAVSQVVEYYLRAW